MKEVQSLGRILGSLQSHDALRMESTPFAHRQGRLTYQDKDGMMLATQGTCGSWGRAAWVSVGHGGSGMDGGVVGARFTDRQDGAQRRLDGAQSTQRAAWDGPLDQNLLHFDQDVCIFIQNLLHRTDLHPKSFASRRRIAKSLGSYWSPSPLDHAQPRH